MSLTNRKKNTFSLIAVFAVVFAAALQAFAYPAPSNKVPVTDSGFSFLPAFKDFTPPVSGLSKENTPEIAEWTRQGQPGDTIVLAGHKLSLFASSSEGRDSRFLMYDEVFGTQDAFVQRLTGQQASLILPEGFARDRMYLLWPRNDNGYGDPVAVNRTEAWWIGPDVTTRGESFSVYGRNLQLGSGNSYVYIEELGKWLTSSSANPYRAEFDVPSDVPNGTYTVWAHNGHGKGFGWAKPFELIIDDPIAWTKGSVTASSASYTDVMTALEKAGDYYVVNIPAGTCYVEQDIELPDNIWLKGAGQGRTIFTVASNYDLEGKSGDAIIDNGKSYGGKYPVLHNAKISDITFDIGNGTVMPGNLVMIKGSRTVIENCTFTHEQLPSKSTANTILDANGSKGAPMTVRNCTFNQSDRVGIGGQVFYEGNTNNGMHDLGSLLKISDGIGISITDSVAKHYDDSDYGDGYGWCQGRFIGGNGRSDYSRNVYIAENTTIDLAPRFNWNYDKWDDNQVHQNAGEQIMCEGQVAEFRGDVSGFSSDSVLCAGLPNDPDYIGMSLVVVSGKGFGQHRVIESVDFSTGNIIVSEPWNVIPDSGSTVTIGSFFSRFVVYKNRLDGVPHVYQDNAQYINTASAGVSFYGGWHDSIVDENTITELETALYTWSLVNHDAAEVNRIVQPNYFNLFVNNKISGCRYAMSSNIYGANHDNVIPDTAMFATVWRGNEFDDISKTVVSESSDNAALTIEMSTFDNNTAETNISSIGKTIGKDMAMTGNKFTAGSGLAMPSFRPVVKGNTISSFSSNKPEGVLEAPIRVIELKESTGSVPIWNCGEGSLSWNASSDQTWLNIIDNSGTVDAQMFEQSVRFEINGSPDVSDTAVITLESGGQEKQISVIISAETAPSPKLSRVSISGPVEINEETSAAFICTGTYEDGSSKEISPVWSISGSTSSIDSDGVVTAGNISSDALITITATVGTLSSEYDVLIKFVPPYILSLSINGPDSVEELTSGQYECIATYSDGTFLDVVPVWSVGSASLAEINEEGLLSAGNVDKVQTVSVNAAFSGVTGSKNVSVLPDTPVLTSLTIIGETAVDEQSTAQYSCEGTFSDGTTVVIAPEWSEDSIYASITSDGLFESIDVSSDQTAVITASYGEFSVEFTVGIHAFTDLVLQWLVVKGESAVVELGSVQFSCEAVYTDGTRTMIVPTWSVNGYASINSDGLLVADDVLEDQVIRVSASYGGIRDSFNLNVLDASPTLVSISIAGPAVLEEGSVAGYNCSATYSDGSTGVVAPAWGMVSSAASINASGLLSAGLLAGDEIVSVTASYNGMSDAFSVLLKDIPENIGPVLTGLQILGPVELNENSEATYLCKATFDDGSEQDVVAEWSIDSALASISAEGTLRVGNIDEEFSMVVTASYQGMNTSGLVKIYETGNQVIYPLSGFENTKVKAALWDDLAQEWHDLGEMDGPTELVVGNINPGNWYKLSIEEFNETSQEWTSVYENWLNM